MLSGLRQCVYLAQCKRTYPDVRLTLSNSIDLQFAHDVYR